ncbi:GntR family transcriptional regulator [Isoptericola sp. NPDC019693]|uniref:GntR family transcriptional regulator n=1 Tax=Isoptericola sp. NPDC019693 TaxID=3364009 RepID=UPI0037889F52
MTHPLSALDRAAPSPLYAQIRDALRQQIESHSIPPGTLLPTEEELQVQYGVSRSVVRQALGELADLGLITRQRGRGSVVAPAPEHRRRAEQAGGLRQQVAATGRHLRTRVVTLEVMPPPAAAAEALGTGTTWRLERVRFVEDEPVIFMRTWLPHRPFSSLTAAGLDGGSLHEWMRSTGTDPIGGPRQVQAVPADELVAEHLQIPVGAPVLLLEGVTRDATGRGVEWFSAWHGPSTVFDVDARVGPDQTGLSTGWSQTTDARLAEARGIVRELAAILEA